MRGGLACLGGSSLDSGEISAVPGSCKVSQRASPLYRARNCVTAHAQLSTWLFIKMAPKAKKKYFRWNTYGRDPN